MYTSYNFRLCSVHPKRFWPIGVRQRNSQGYLLKADNRLLHLIND